FLHDRILGVNTTSDSTYFAIIYSPNTTVSGNAFVQNLIKYGSYGFYMNASFGAYGVQNIIYDNIIDSAHYAGIYTEYQDSITILKNKISNLGSAGYGIYIHAFGNSNILKNNIILPKGGTGIYATYSYLPYAKSDSTFFANNMISMGGKYSIGIYAEDGYQQYVNFYYNTVLMLSTNTTNYAIEIKAFNTTSNFTLYNNIFQNEGAGYCIYIPNSNYGLSTCDYNNLYTKGTYIGFANSTNYKTLANWQTGSGDDVHSVSKAAAFFSNTDLHLKKISGLNKGKILTSISDDFDGQPRNPNPFLGADELKSVYKNDIGLASIDSPGLSVCNGSQNIVITLVNYGTSTITSADIKYQVNGGTVVNFSWSGSLTSGSKTSLKVGSYTFGKCITYNLIAYTANPNGVTDSNATNDSATTPNFITSLSGIYKIGGPGNDYKTFAIAVKALTKNGVCGPVIFEVADSTYTEQIEIGNINGTSLINSIIFQSKKGDSSKVILTYPGGGFYRYTLHLNAANFITFKKITIAKSGTSMYSTVVEIDGGANNNSFSHCRFLGVKSTLGSPYQSIIYGLNLSNKNNSFIRNLFKYGSYDFYLNGTSTSNDKNTLIKDNIMDSAYYYGIYAQYQDSISIINNRITNLLNTAACYGIYLNFYGNSHIEKNIILTNNKGYGIYSG
ncbi:MAG: right-handed parallel beta-helix repeat-containing protein, partial [Bacteroidetes bacterium]|nr:right-handed parallel beta-helix repeat-containing protein [Bacteroidota bacterium]